MTPDYLDILSEAKPRKKGCRGINPDGHLTIENEKGDVFIVDPLTVRIWEYCDGKRKLGELAEEMAKKADADLDFTKKIVYSTAAEMRITEILELDELSVNEKEN